MKTIQKAIYFPAELVNAVEEYQRENYINSFTQAIIQLVRKGLGK